MLRRLSLLILYVVASFVLVIVLTVLSPLGWALAAIGVGAIGVLTIQLVIAVLLSFLIVRTFFGPRKKRRRARIPPRMR